MTELQRHDTPDDPEIWVQLNVGLVRREGHALPSARALFGKIAPLVEAWRSAGKLEVFFFMRKPPDVRLRFRVSANHDARSPLDAVLLELRHAGHVDTFFYSNYEPETERFGGPDGMRSVHRYFDADTRMWLCLDKLEQHSRRRLTPETLLPALVQDLFLRAADGRRDVVAACWQRLLSQIATPAASPLPAPARKVVDGLSGIVDDCEEKECVALGTRANDALARELAELVREGRLAAGLADVLASVSLFSFHRHGFAGERSAPLVAAVLESLEDRTAV